MLICSGYPSSQSSTSAASFLREVCLALKALFVLEGSKGWSAKEVFSWDKSG